MRRHVRIDRIHTVSW